MDDRYLTIKEVAEILSVTPLTLRNWDRKGLLTAYRNPANNYRLYRRAEIAEFVGSIKKTAPRESPLSSEQTARIPEPPAIQKLFVRLEEDEVRDAV